jgi:Tfp pilus assembly protein PilO
MPKLIDEKMFKAVGIYLIIILALIRFILYPLHASIAKEKIIFNELNETYQFKLKHSAGQSPDRQQPPLPGRIDKEVIGRSLYDKAMLFSSIQADLLDVIIKTAEKKGLTVQNFEMPEATTGKVISEVPILVRLSGKPADILALLKSIASEDKALQIRSLEMNKSNQEMMLALTLVSFRMEK